MLSLYLHLPYATNQSQASKHLLSMKHTYDKGIIFNNVAFKYLTVFFKQFSQFSQADGWRYIPNVKFRRHIQLNWIKTKLKTNKYFLKSDVYEPKQTDLAECNVIDVVT